MTSTFPTPTRGLSQIPARASAWMNVDVPQPTPDIVPLPPSPHPVPPPPAVPPEITEPLLPGQNEPVREPIVPTTSPIIGRLH